MGMVRITDTASEDLHDLWYYVSRHSPTAADRMLDTITGRMDLLSDFPSLGKSREDLGDGIRTLVFREFVIFYRPIDAGIEIARVLDGRRDYARLFT